MKRFDKRDIILLPTSKRSYKAGDIVAEKFMGAIISAVDEPESNPYWIPHYMYIVDKSMPTNVGDWCIDIEDNELILSQGNVPINPYCVRVVASTDPVLIESGVENVVLIKQCLELYNSKEGEVKFDDDVRQAALRYAINVDKEYTKRSSDDFHGTIANNVAFDCWNNAIEWYKANKLAAEIISFANWLRDNTVADGARKLYYHKTKQRLTIEQCYQEWFKINN